MDLFKLSNTLEGLAPLTLDDRLCSRTFSPLSTCQKCQAICPHQALSFDGTHWQIDGSCTCCGLCVTVCPNHAVSLEENALLEQAKLTKQLILGCYHSAWTTENLVTINCFQQLYPELIFRLLEHVDSLIICADQKQCQNCANHWYADGLGILLGQFGLPVDKLTILTDSNAITALLRKENGATNTGRRSFLQHLCGRTKHASKKAALTSLDHVLAPLYDESDTQEIASSVVISQRIPLLKYYNANLPALDLQIELPYRQLKTDFCTFCGACVRLCPTNALTIITKEDQQYLTLTPSLCTQCNLCQDVCFQKKLYWSDRLTIAQFIAPESLIIAQAAKQLCSRCEQDFWQDPPADDGVCAICHRS